jgi:hypothetical protein
MKGSVNDNHLFCEGVGPIERHIVPRPAPGAHAKKSPEESDLGRISPGCLGKPNPPEMVRERGAEEESRIAIRLHRP